MRIYESIRPISAGEGIYKDKPRDLQKNIKYPAYINFKLYMKISELEKQGKSWDQIKRETSATDLQIQAYKNTKAQQIQVKGY
jgi:hypothetical protein